MTVTESWGSFLFKFEENENKKKHHQRSEDKMPVLAVGRLQQTRADVTDSVSKKH